MLCCGIFFSILSPFASYGSSISAGQQKQLLELDIARLRNFPNKRGFDYDRRTNGLFSKIFTKPNGFAVSKFISSRISFFIFHGELIRESPNNLPFMNWEDGNSATNSFQTEIDFSFVAENISMPTWLKSVVNQQRVDIVTTNKVIRVYSSRPAIVMLGSGYTTQISTSRGSLKIPWIYRIGKLIHEARHSDCTGGFFKSDVALAKKSRSSQEFMTFFKSSRCGYLHALCFSNDPDLRGTYACEREPWGPYSIEAIFFDAMKEGLAHDSAEYLQMDLFARDAKRRLNFRFEDLVSGLLGPPDLTNLNRIVND